MLLSPSRADCIIFGIDNVLTDSTAAYSAAIARCVASLWSEMNESKPEEEINAEQYYKAAFGKLYYGDVAWALLSAMLKNGAKTANEALPTLTEWEDMLAKAQRDGLATLSVPSLNRDIIAKRCSEFYIGSSDDGTCTLEKPIFHKMWNTLTMPVLVCTPRPKNEALYALSAIGWGSLPQACVVCGDAYGKKGVIENICSKIGCDWPLYIGALPSDQKLALEYAKGDFITIGNGISASVIRFLSAADAIRAILGIV